MTDEDIQNMHRFNESTDEPNRIMAIGVGGGGNNAINHMFRQGVQNVTYVVANTDRQALNNSPVPTRVLLGPTVSGGRGAGNDPEVGRLAAEESAEQVSELFDDDTDMVFITAGMGGGTGTGAAPVVARIAKERGLLTIGIVTIPFLFEGEKKIRKAIAGADELRKYVDALLVINNERLTEIHRDLAFINAFAKADDTLSTAAQSISEIITGGGYMNLDFKDVDTTLRNGGTAIISTGYGEGQNRVTKAIEDALHSPLLKNTDVLTSKKLLFNLYYSPKSENEFTTAEADELTAFVSNIDKQVDVIWGLAFDDSLGDKVKITILASGFDITVNDSIKDKIKAAAPARPNVTPEKRPAASDEPEDNSIEKFYGSDKIKQLEDEKNKQRYFILNDTELDNDEIIDLVEKTPAYNRDRRIINRDRKNGAPTPPPVAEGSDNDIVWSPEDLK